MERMLAYYNLFAEWTVELFSHAWIVLSFCCRDLCISSQIDEARTLIAMCFSDISCGRVALCFYRGYSNIFLATRRCCLPWAFVRQLLDGSIRSAVLRRVQILKDEVAIERVDLCCLSDWRITFVSERRRRHLQRLALGDAAMHENFEAQFYHTLLSLRQEQSLIEEEERWKLAIESMKWIATSSRFKWITQSK